MATDRMTLARAFQASGMIGRLIEGTFPTRARVGTA